MNISNEVRKKLLAYQRSEITEHHVYLKLARAVKSPENMLVLEKIVHEELAHYHTWRKYTQRDVKPDRLNIWKYYLVGRIAAALSMGASEYLSTRSEETDRNPARASIYTGGAYVITVFILMLPYLILENYFICLGCTLAAAVLIIAFFNYYISVAKDLPFKRRFLEMAVLSLGVAALSFFIVLVLRSFLGVDV